MMTDEQAALLAAAQLHTGSAGHASTEAILSRADQFLDWLEGKTK